MGELYRRHRGVVRGYVLTRIARGDDAEDVVQETFLRAAKQAGRVPGRGRATGCRRGCAGRPARSCASTASGTGTRTWPRRGRRGSRPGARSPRPPRRAKRPRCPSRCGPRSGGLTPGERRAIQLRYIDGLNPEQAAEIAGVRRRSLHRRVADGRRKLAAELADLAPRPAHRCGAAAPRGVTRALAATRDDVPAAAQWLRKQGVHASEANLYRYRQMLQAGEPLPGEQASRGDRCAPAYPAYTPPEHIAAVSSALERARAAGLDYRTRFGRLPTRREVMDAVGVSESTATRALRPLKADAVVNAQPTVDPRPGAHAGNRPHRGRARHGATGRAGRGCRPSPRPRCAPAR